MYSVSPATRFRYVSTRFVVVRPFHADMLRLQVQQVKKTNKFTCRMCQAPQSVRKASSPCHCTRGCVFACSLHECCAPDAQVYAVSTQAKDVRYVVMELNAKLGETAQQPTSKPQKTMQPGAIASADQNQWSCFMSEVTMLLQFWS